MNDLEHEILFLRQALIAQRVRAALPPAAPKGARQAFAALPVPQTNGIRGSERQVTFAALPMAPEPKLTTFGHVSQEGILRKQIAEKEAEIARLRKELGL